MVSKMGGRYWITGVQIGMLMAKGTEVLTEIQENQFIGEMPQPHEDYEIVIRKKKRRKGCKK